MLKNYFKIAYRNLLKNKLYSVINVFGLSVAIAFCIVAYLNHDYNFSFDSFHQNAEKIFRVKSVRVSQGREQPWGSVPRPLGPALAQDFPAIEKAVRLTANGVVFRHGDKVFNENVLHADPGFFEMFTFPLKYGNPEVLRDKNKIVLSEALATKYFGDENPIGKQVTMRYRDGQPREFFVGAVAQKIPDNSSIQFDALAAFEVLLDAGIDKADDWSDWAHVLFVQISDRTQIANLSNSMAPYLAVHNAAVAPEWQIKRFHFDPLHGLALKGRETRFEILKEAMHPAGMISPSIIAALLLLMACFNYINTSIAYSSQRLKEIGIRKVVGGVRRQLIWQFLGENLLLCTIALLAALALAEVFVPAYDNLWAYFKLELDYSENWGLLAFLAGLLMFLGIVAGTYPALYISAYHPVKILRGKQKFGRASWLSRALLTFQFTTSILTVIASLVFVQNAGFLRRLDLGYGKDLIVVVPLREAKFFEPYRNAITQNPEIVSTGGSFNHVGFNWGSATVASAAHKTEAIVLGVGYNYLETMQLRVSRGRSFDEDLATDAQSAIVVNQKFVQQFAWENPLGQTVTMDTVRYTVVGVVEDFYNDGVWRPIQPCLFRVIKPDQFRNLAVRVRGENLKQTSDFLRATWQSVVPDLPYEGFYQDEVMAEAIQVSENIKTMFLYISVLAIVIAAMGLFALVSLNIARRTKEIGVRKVLGASMAHLMNLINKEFVRILLAATLVASVAGYFAVQALLQSIYAYHVGFSALPFVFAGAIVFTIAAITVGSQVVKVALANPVQALRYE
ncbi:MAG: ABC transporter permease [bacterium]